VQWAGPAVGICTGERGGVSSDKTFVKLSRHTQGAVLQTEKTKLAVKYRKLLELTWLLKDCPSMDIISGSVDWKTCYHHEGCFIFIFTCYLLYLDSRHCCFVLAILRHNFRHILRVWYIFQALSIHKFALLKSYSGIKLLSLLTIEQPERNFCRIQNLTWMDQRKKSYFPFQELVLHLIPSSPLTLALPGLGRLTRNSGAVWRYTTRHTCSYLG
jgi:hypothetical protein